MTNTDFLLAIRDSIGLRFSGAVIVCLLGSMLVPRPASAQTAAGKQPPIESREAMLLWLDEYLARPVLIQPEDVEKLRENITKMSSQELNEFIAKTSELRATVESPEWQETKDWLRQFLRVQAIYSDKEIADLRKRIPDMDAGELIELMEKIRDKHNTLRWMHSASERSRKTSVQGVQNLQRQQEAARVAARQNSASRPLYGSATSGASQRRDRGYRPPAPLINSRDVARGAVYRSVFPSRRGW